METTFPVSIIGAGPGDPELLTVKAHRLLTEADVVVYDRLVSERILDILNPGTTKIFAGKASRDHAMPQDEINELLVSLAKSNRRVVRLKGGDPFVFGRGSEEAQHLAQNNIPFEVVPGVTAASGCLAYAGIPLTHRGMAKGVRFVTGHRQDGTHLDLNWQSLADPETTLVIYMGLTNVQKISDELIAAGLPADFPVAAVENGTLRKQRSLVSTLSGLPEALKKADMKPPTLIVIGEVATLAKELGWHVPALDQDLEAHG